MRPLWPDPADKHCPQHFRQESAQLIMDFAKEVMTKKHLANTCDPGTFGKWTSLSKPGGHLDSDNPNHLNVLRFALLDFIADFANWDNSTVKEYLDTARCLTQAAHEALGGDPGSKPLVVDHLPGAAPYHWRALRVGRMPLLRT